MMWRCAHGVGRVLAWCWSRVLRTRKTEMMHRVQARLGLPEEYASGVVRGVYQCLARGLVEVCLTRVFKQRLPPTEVRGFEYLSELKKRNDGFVVVTAHLGNWELLTRLDYYCGIEGLFVSKRFRWTFFQRLLANVRRDAVRSVDTQGSAREIIKVLKAGGAAGFAVDQHSNETAALPLTFLGAKAWVTTSPAKVARIAGVPIVPVRTFWEHGRHVVEIHEPLRYDWTEKKEADLEHVAHWYTGITEGWVRDQPEQWLWLHRRWKARRAIR